MEVISMGMTDAQFAAFRRKELREYQELLEMIEETGADERVIKKLKILIEDARKDTEK